MAFKKGEKGDPEGTTDYWVSPQSLRRVVEQLILVAIFTHREDKKVIRSSQHEFTKGKSFLTNLIAF